jgi:adenylate kinase
MRIAISGSVGVGKTTIAQQLAQKLDFQLIHLNEIAEKFKVEDQEKLQTFDFDVKACLEYIENNYNNSQHIIFEGHFAHLLSPSFIDIIVIINRDVAELQEEYKRRGYNKEKIEQNSDVENFNVCFYEAEEEGYEENQFIVYENSSQFEVEECVQILFKKIQKKSTIIRKND